MKVLFVTACYKPYIGGVERVVEQLSCRFVQRPEIEDVGILTSYYRYPPVPLRGIPSVERLDGANVFRLRFFPRALPFFYHLETGVFAPALKHTINRFRPTVVHYLICEWFLPNLIVNNITRNRSAQIMSVFNHSFRSGPRTWPFALINRYLCRRMDAVHVVTEQARSIVSNAFKFPLNLTTVIPLGVNVSPSPPKPKTTRRDQDIIILSVGRLDSRKNQFDLVKCFHQTLKRTDRPCRLLLVGQDAGQGTVIRDYIEKHDLREHVILVGEVREDELIKLYKAADIFALLTLEESYGLVFLEAMAAGLPIIAYNVPGPGHFLTDKAFLIDRENKDKVVSTLLELVNNDAKRSQLSIEAHQHAREHVSWDQVTDRMIGLYLSALSKGKVA